MTKRSTGSVWVAFALGALAFALALLPEASPRPVSFVLPEEAIYETATLGTESTGAGVDEPATLDSHLRHRVRRAGDDWVDTVLASKGPSGIARPGERTEYIDGVYRWISAGGRVRQTETSDVRIISHLEHELNGVAVDPPPALPRRLVGRNRRCGRSMCDEYLVVQHVARGDPPLRGYATIPRKASNLLETSLFFEDGTDLLRKRIERWNGVTIRRFELLCHEPGPDRC